MQEDREAIIRQQAQTIAVLQRKIKDFDQERNSFQLHIQELAQRYENGKESEKRLRRSQHELTVLLANKKRSQRELTVLLANKKILINNISTLIGQNTNRGIQPRETCETIGQMVMPQNQPSGDIISEICFALGNFYGQRVREQQLMDKTTLMIQECQNLMQAANHEKKVYESLLNSSSSSSITANSSNINSQISESSKISQSQPQQ